MPPFNLKKEDKEGFCRIVQVKTGAEGNQLKAVNMKSTRKICAFIIAVTMISMSVISAYAATVKFTDIGSHWARPYIEKLTAAKITTGVEVKNGVGKYAPEAPVKRVEVVTMLIRLLGLEEEAKGMTLPSTFPKAAEVPEWAKGTVAMALTKGIIPVNEDFRANEDALREDVAIMTVRALGFGSEAESKTTVNTKILSFSDAPLIGLKARPYVEVAIEKGIMSGMGDNKFDPKGKFTRGQMAKLIDNSLQYKPLKSQVLGEVDSVETTLLKNITIKLSGGVLKTYSVDNDAGLYKRVDNNLEKTALDKIKAGDKVCVWPDDNPNITYYVEVLSADGVTPTPAGQEVKGSIKDINTVFRRIIVTKSNGDDESFEIPVGVNIYTDNQLASFMDLTLGQSVTVIVSGGSVTRIDAQKVEKAKSVKGILRVIGSNSISVQRGTDYVTESFNVGSGLQCIKDNKNVTIQDLLAGDIVELTVVGNTATKIDARSFAQEISGYLWSVNLAPKFPVMTVETSKGTTVDYEFSASVSITKNQNRYAEVEDLKKGDEVLLRLEYDKIVSIVAKSVKTNVSGTIKSITFEKETTRITITDDGGKDYTFFVTRNTDLREGKKSCSPEELKIGYHLDVEVENEEAITARVTIQEELLTFQGIIKTINTKREILIVEAGKDSRDIYYNSDTLFIKGKSSVTVKKILEGDKVIVVGEYIDGVLEASSVIVLNLD